MSTNGLGRAASLHHVASQAALEAYFIRRFDIGLQAVYRQKLGIDQGEQPFDDQECPWVDGFSLIENPRVGGEIVEGAFDALATGERCDVCSQEQALNQSRIVKILQGAFVARKM